MKMTTVCPIHKQHGATLNSDYIIPASVVSDTCVKTQLKSNIKCYKRLVLSLSIFASLLCLVIITIIVISTTFQKNKGVSRLGTKPVACVICNKLSPNISGSEVLLNSLTREVSDGVELCCAYRGHQLSDLLELILRLREKDSESLPTINVSKFSFIPVSAHKRIFPPINPHTEIPYENRVPIMVKSAVRVLFQHQGFEMDPLVEHVRGVEVLPDGLRIIHPGFYYVYSSIHFRPESPRPCKDFQYQTWNQYLEKTSPLDPAQSGCLLKVAHTCCDICTRDEETSYTGGVFYLDKNDVVQIAIDGYGLVNFRRDTSFVGLMMLSTGKSKQQ
ncbi:tumor necrosis factor ligand superfamily member 6 [Biomphalaria glabrata]